MTGGKKRSPRPTKSAKVSAANVPAQQAEPAPVTAKKYLHPDGELSILSVDAATPGFKLSPRQRNRIDEAVRAIQSMLRQGYTLLVADHHGVYTRVCGFDEQRRCFLVPGSRGMRLAIPVGRAHALALPRPAGG